jgi:hypothetical protein
MTLDVVDSPCPYCDAFSMGMLCACACILLGVFVAQTLLRRKSVVYNIVVAPKPETKNDAAPNPDTAS